MKSILLSICLLAVLAACQDPASEYEAPASLAGTAWQMEYSMEIHEDTSFRHVPEDWVRIKTFTRNRWTFTGYDFGKKEIAGIGGGTYSLVDGAYEEQIEFHHESAFNGTTFEGKLRFDSLYLYQIGTVGPYTLEERWKRID